eukprot:366029-Chlamydomonas_euryale.AAC.42
MHACSRACSPGSCQALCAPGLEDHERHNRRWQRNDAQREDWQNLPHAIVGLTVTRCARCNAPPCRALQCNSRTSSTAAAMAHQHRRRLRRSSVACTAWRVYSGRGRGKRVGLSNRDTAAQCASGRRLRATHRWLPSPPEGLAAAPLQRSLCPPRSTAERGSRLRPPRCSRELEAEYAADPRDQGTQTDRCRSWAAPRWLWPARCHVRASLCASLCCVLERGAQPAALQGPVARGV